MKISILAATLGIATLAATPLFAQSGTQSPNAGKNPSATESPSGGTSGGMSHQKGMSRGGMSHDMSKGMSHRSRSSRAGGMSSQTVMQVQQKLSQQGLDVGPVDGKMGPKTRSAVKQFQDQKGIQGNGRLNRQTLAALGVESQRGRSGGSHGPSSGMGSGSSGSGMGSGSSGGGTAH